MGFKVEVDHGDKLILYTHEGDIEREDIGEAWGKLLVMKEFTELNYNLYSDYSRARFNVKKEDIPFIVEFLQQQKHIVDGKKQALLLEDPVSTAHSMLFEKEVKNKTGFHVRVFSTRRAAYGWLMK